MERGNNPYGQETTMQDGWMKIGVLGCNSVIPRNVNEPPTGEGTAVGNAANAATADSLAVGDGASAHGKKSVAIGSGSVASNDNECSVGAPATESTAESTREVTHVSEPTAPTSAATKSYVDDNTSNALVGNVSGKLLHVEDAWPGKPIGLTIDGKSEQVKTTGINLWDIEHPTNLTDGESITRNSDGTYQAVTNTKYRDAHYLVPVEAGATYYIRVKAPVFVGVGKHYTSIYDGETTDSKALLNSVLIDEQHNLRKFVPTGSTVLVSYRISSASVVEGGITIVEPMICKSASLVAWEPYSGGKPSPRPDFPQEINSIANVGVAVRGKNLLEYPYFNTTKEESGLTFTDNGDGTISISGTMTDPYYAEFKFTSMEHESGWSLPSGEYTLFCDAPEGVNILIVGVANGLEDRPIAAISSSGPGANIADFTVMDNEFIYVCLQMFNEGASNNGVVKVGIYAKSSNTYSPYVGSTTHITLPAEHPYLASLPDGTHDEIVIDKDGNASLVARVGKVKVAEQALSFINDTVPFVAFQLQIVGGKSDALISNTYKSSNYSAESGYIYSPNSIDVVVRDSRFTSLDVAKDLLVDTVLYYERLTAVTYQIGKLTVPSLPETISNVWTDAELTTNMSMTYKRDINTLLDRDKLPIASTTNRGTVKVGHGLDVDADGTLWVTESDSIPLAQTVTARTSEKNFAITGSPNDVASHKALMPVFNCGGYYSTFGGYFYLDLKNSYKSGTKIHIELDVVWQDTHICSPIHRVAVVEIQQNTYTIPFGPSMYRGPDYNWYYWSFDVPVTADVPAKTQIHVNVF